MNDIPLNQNHWDEDGGMTLSNHYTRFNIPSCGSLGIFFRTTPSVTTLKNTNLLRNSCLGLDKGKVKYYFFRVE